MAELEEQLSEIEVLLQDSPDDESLLKLKEDLLELIELEKSTETETVENSVDDTTANDAVEDKEFDAARGNGAVNDDPTLPDMKAPLNPSESTSFAQAPSDNADLQSTTTTVETATTASSTTTSNAVTAAAKPKSSKKKNQKILNATFEIPPELLPLQSDTDAIRQKKQRKIKKLKSTFRSKQKSAESEVKQKSWQNFSKKRKKTKKGSSSAGGSIFRTEDGIGARVGVISGNVSVLGQERDSAAAATGTSNKRSRHAF